VFIVTTKQARFASAIMEQKGNLHIPPERVFSQTVSGRSRAPSTFPFPLPPPLLLLFSLPPSLSRPLPFLAITVITLYT
jgi:hypothetical protein